jgi:hypothetical protein
MLGSILKTAAYVKAPKATFTVLHPTKAFRLGKLRYDMRHAWAPRIAAVAAAVLALALGYFLGRSGNGRDPDEG